MFAPGTPSTGELGDGDASTTGGGSDGTIDDSDTSGRPVPSTVSRGPFLSVQVNVDEDGQNIPHDAANEPSIAVNPTDPRNVVITWRQFDDVRSDFRQAGVARSEDAGQTWAVVGPLGAGVFRSDPVVRADADGRFYFLSTQVDEANEAFRSDLFVSEDQGRTWTGPTPAFGGDKPWMAIDRTDGPGRGNIYLNWSSYYGCCEGMHFSRSTDGGATFSGPIGLDTPPNFGTVAVGPDGELYMIGTDFFLVKSLNAQFADQAPEFGDAIYVDVGGTAGYFGNWPNLGGLSGQAWIATDHSATPLRGSVYVVATVESADGSDPADVIFVRSTDGGATWSPPVRINDDPRTEFAYTWQWFATMDVAPTGRIDVIWNDTRNSYDAFMSELYYSYSFDGGETWSANVPVSPAFDSWLGWPGQHKLGDYYDIASDRAGVSIAYSATFNGEQDVYFLRVGDCNGNGFHDGAEIRLFPTMDADGNGILDLCESATAPN